VGWTEAMQLMSEGSKWQIIIPPSIGVKDQGMPPNVGPNSVLIFDVELISVKKADETGKADKTGKTEKETKN
jgi:FKBP-type peptidyl-prolyl cis-trans isomerase